MPRIPLPPRVSSGAYQGDRLSGASPDMAAPARALAGLGKALSGLGEQHAADAKRMEGYKANLALERWSTDQTLGYQKDLETSAPDGADFLAKREANLKTSYQSVASSITDPEQRARADVIYEQTLGTQKIKGYGDVRGKQKNFVLASTDDGINGAVSTGQIQSEEQYQDYFENVIKPKIDSIITDPLERNTAYATFGKKLGGEFLRRNPELAAPKITKGSSSGLAGAIRKSAAELGVSPLDMATVISYETAGKFSTSIMGGKGGRYMGLIQFGEEERRMYGASAGQTQEQQMEAVTRYLKDRGVKPGMSILDIYSTINAGSPGRYNASDGPGQTVALHVKGMMQSPHRANAEKLLGGGDMGLPYVSTDPPKPTEGMWRYVSDTEWDGMSSAARAAEEDRRKVADEQEKLAKDELVRGGIDLVTEDKLTAQWLDENREKLTPSEYRTFSNALEKQDGLGNVTDRIGYLGFLQQAAEAEDQGAVQDDAIKAFSDGELNKTDFNKIISLSKATAKHRTDKPWLGDIRNTLRARLAPLDREDTEQYARRLDGLFALDDWIENNPEASRDEIKKKANEVAKEFSDASNIDLRSGLDTPQYSTVGRYAMTPDAIAIAAQKLAQAYKEGKIGQEAYIREGNLLMKWKKVLDEEARGK